jgi:hypothetical protein
MSPRILFVAAVLALAAGLVRARGQEKPSDLGREGGEAAPSIGTSVREALPGGAPEIAGYREKIVFLLDRSGSMGIADRYLTALDIVDQLLLEMPKETLFDLYLFDHGQKSLFEGNWLRPTSDTRDSLRKRIAAAGGLDYGGFTDLATALRTVAEKRRPEAIYLLTDGVATLGEIDTEKIVAAVGKALKPLKIPVHTIGIGLGLDPAEDPDQAQAVLQGISEATGGIAREVKSKKRPILRAFRLPPPWAPPPAEERATFHLKINGTRETNARIVSADTSFEIEIEDPTFRAGPVALEYSDPKLIIRTYLSNGRLFLESRAIALKRSGDRLVSVNPVSFVGPEADSTQDNLNSKGAIEIKCPKDGSADLIYRRGPREFREGLLVGPPPPTRRGDRG